jgi:Tol biopolymer transport system component
VTPGKRFGPYEIVSPVGAGGMGEVWKARDTRLDRSVAVKFLPPELARNPQLKIRFDREARAISQLSHPHICTLFDVGDDYLVMELLEGESLAERLAKGPLPVEDVFRYGAQIADALDRAHRAGIVHRDLKPANVMLTKSGAKLLDFGLAKTEEPVVEMDGATEHRPLTREGTILGTFQYMAPEQLEGREADPRTDIFALGALLYEMATGKRAFQGSSKTSLIASIVGGSPRPLGEVRPMAPASLEHIIAKCLEKDPDQRWYSAHDVAQELLWSAERQEKVEAVAHPRRQKLLVAALAASLIALAALAAWHFMPRTAPVIVTSIVPPPGLSFAVEASSVLIAPDGRRVVFAASDEKQATHLYVRDLGTGNIQLLPHTNGASYPFWSPDSRSIAFFEAGKLVSIKADGGPAQTIADTVDPRGGAWGPDGTIVFNSNFRDGLFRVPAAGGTPVRVTKLSAGEISHRWPAFLPDGEHVLFLAQRAEGGASSDPSTIEAISLKTGRRTSLVRANSSPLYAAPGYLLFWRDKTLLAQKFDAGSLELSGEPAVLAEDVAYASTELMIASASQQGTLVYQVTTESGQSRLVLSDAQGLHSPVAVDLLHDRYSGLSLSRDGRRLAYSVVGQGDDLRIFDLVRGTKSRLTFDAADETSAVWSPDDSRIAFFSNRRDGGDVYVIGTSGTDTEKLVLASPESTTPSDWSPDGNELLLTSTDAKGAVDIWTYSFRENRAVPLIQTPFEESEATYSPDGKWIAFTSDQSGRPEIHLTARDGSGGRWQVSRGGGTQAAWRADGKALYFLTDEGQLFSVTIADGAQPQIGAPTPLFNFRRGFAKSLSRSFSVFPDGQKFVLATSSANTALPATMVQNWTGMLRKRE